MLIVSTYTPNVNAVTHLSRTPRTCNTDGHPKQQHSLTGERTW